MTRPVMPVGKLPNNPTPRRNGRSSLSPRLWHKIERDALSYLVEGEGIVITKSDRAHLRAGRTDRVAKAKIRAIKKFAVAVGLLKPRARRDRVWEWHVVARYGARALYTKIKRTHL